MKLKKGDHVIVLTGKHKGEMADVMTVLPSKNAVILDSLNIAKRHTSMRSAQGRGNQRVSQAGIIDKFMPMDASDVALWCGKHQGAARAGFREDHGKKVRFCRKCGELL
ncbi:MAG TPA: 50S ribosomal protein L24 [Acidimicrobiales bacterium]|jgi:large subunit ribosomal protein L24|nr:50S ribosomal protein L24 [Acidimicrobiales bacterium]